MKEWIIWAFSNQMPYGIIMLILGFMMGWIFGHTAKTRPIEIERDQALSDLDAALWTIELKQSAAGQRQEGGGMSDHKIIAGLKQALADDVSRVTVKQPTGSLTAAVQQEADGRWRVKLIFDDGFAAFSEETFPTKPAATDAIARWCESVGGTFRTAQ